MDLGCGTLRRIRLNVLHSALHHHHGLAWTDGHAVYLVAINIIYDEVENNSPVKLGEFDHVSSLQWSADIGESHCYLCVVHVTTVSLWKVHGSSPKLSFKQIRKIYAKPVAQGCLWNPMKDVLCIMNKEQCTFYFRHLDKKGSYSLPPIDSGKISCGCWSLDGTKLIIGIGSIILIYQWTDLDVALNDYTITAWKIPNVDGSICSMAPVSGSRIVCSVETPLDTMCKTNGSMFEMPDVMSEASLDSFDSNTMNDNDDVIHPKATANSGSYVNSLLNIPVSSKLPGRDCSQLVLFELQTNNMEPAKLHSNNIPGILSPDLLYCAVSSSTSCAFSPDPDVSGMVVVGSNSQNRLHVYNVYDNQLQHAQVMQLASDERPKGLCGVSVHVHLEREGVLIIVGKIPQLDPAFPPSSLDMDYTLRLSYMTFTSDINAAGGVNPSSSAPKSSVIGDKIPDKNINFSRNHYSSETEINSSRLVHDMSGPRSVFGSLGEVCQTSLSGTMSESNGMLSPRHLLLQRVGSSPGMKCGPLEEKLRGSHSRSSSTMSSNGTEFVTRANLLLPGRFSMSSRPKTKSIEILGESSQNDGLETQLVDFRQQSVSFQNENGIQKLKNDGVFIKKDAELDDIDILNNSVTRHKSTLFDKFSTSNDLSCLCSYDSVSDSDITQDGDGQKELTRDHKCQDCHVKSSNMFHQVAALEKQLDSQQKHIIELQKRVYEISRLLDETVAPSYRPASSETVAPSQSAYRPASSPDLVFLTYTPKGGTEQSVTKAFILDSCRLQLESVKHAFGLSTVELIIDGMSCVVGANVEGYIPLKFTCKDTMHISGQKLGTCINISSQPSVPKLNGICNPILGNDDILDTPQGTGQVTQPDITANHQPVGTFKHNTPSSTFC